MAEVENLASQHGGIVHEVGGCPASATSNRWLTAVAFCVGLFMIFVGLGQLPLMEPDEGRNAEVAREMKNATSWSRSWLIPTLDGLPYMDKPAFYFKTVALSFALLGESETTARLPSALFGFALLGMVYLFCRRVYNARCAALAVLVVATCPMYFVIARVVIMDMPLAFFVCGAVFAGYLAEDSDDPRRKRWYLLATASAAVGTLVKGPIGFFLPLLVLTIFNWLDGKRDFWKRYLAARNVLLFFAIVLPWFIGASFFERDFPYYGVVYETFLRLVTPEFTPRGGPIYFFVPVVIAGFLVWSLLLPEGALAAWTTRKRRHRADRLFIVWSIATFVFFSLPQSKRPDYILSMMVSLGALTARVFDRAFECPDGRSARRVQRASVALAVVALLVAVLLAVGVFHPATLIGTFHLEGESIEPLASFFPPMLIAAVVLFVLAVVAGVRRNARLAFAAFALFAPLLATASFGGLRQGSEAHSARELAQRLMPLPPAAEIACIGRLPMGLMFYLKRTITVACHDGFELTSFYIAFELRRRHPWPQVTIPLQEFDRWVATRDHPVYLISKQRGHPRLDAIATQHGATVTEVLPKRRWAALIVPKGGD